MSKELRNANGQLLGTLRDLGYGKTELRDAAGRLLGVYNTSVDETRDASGRLVGKGNLLTSLLR